MTTRPKYSPKRRTSGFYGNKLIFYRYNETLDKDILCLNPYLSTIIAIFISTYCAYLFY